MHDVYALAGVIAITLKQLWMKTDLKITRI